MEKDNKLIGRRGEKGNGKVKMGLTRVTSSDNIGFGRNHMVPPAGVTTRFPSWFSPPGIRFFSFSLSEALSSLRCNVQLTGLSSVAGCSLSYNDNFL